MTSPLLRWAGVALWLAVAILAAACSTAPATKEQTRLDIRIEATTGMNPDDEGRAAPVLVRVYELRNAAAFDAADFFALQNDSKNTLGADVLAVDEYLLRPGESQLIQRKSRPETVAIGVLAAYRDLGHAVWRRTWPLAAPPDAAWYRAVIPDARAKLKITLDTQTLRVAAQDEH